MRTPIGFWVLVLIIIITDWDSTGKWLTFLFSFMALIVLAVFIQKTISLTKADLKKDAEKRRRRKERREREEQRLIKGKLEGKLEGLYQTATNMKKSGIDLQTIVDCTGLSMEEVEKL